VSFIVDASVVIAWALREVHPTAALALARIEIDPGLVPALWWFEVRNGLIINERRGRIRETRTSEFLQELERIAVLVDAAPLEDQVLTLARRHRLTVYDAAYLELAMRASLPLATLDAALIRAARAEAVKLIGEGAG
jgi:predicted nucleic acid-binding protein